MSRQIKIMVIPMAILATFFVSFLIADDQPDPKQTKENDIRRLLVLMKTVEIMQQSSVNAIEMQKRSNPNIPDEFWKRFKKEIDSDEFIDLIIPIYDKHFSHDEIIALCEFYDSPLGRRLTEETPLIMIESSKAGELWGMQAGQRVVQEMINEGYQFNGRQ